MSLGLVSCVWGRFVELCKVSYSPLAFGYILWKVRSTIGWRVASEEGMVPCIRLVTIPLLLFTFCGRWRAPWVGELIWGRYGASIRLVTIIYMWLHPMEGEEYHGLVSCIWGRYGAKQKFSYSHIAFDYILWKVRSSMGWWVASVERMLTLVWLVTLTLFLITYFRRWRAPYVGELHLRKVWWTTYC